MGSVLGTLTFTAKAPGLAVIDFNENTAEPTAIYGIATHQNILLTKTTAAFIITTGSTTSTGSFGVGSTICVVSGSGSAVGGSPCPVTGLGSTGTGRTVISPVTGSGSTGSGSTGGRGPITGTGTTGSGNLSIPLPLPISGSGTTSRGVTLPVEPITNPCLPASPDINGDGKVNLPDLSFALDEIGKSGSGALKADLTGNDCKVNSADYSFLLNALVKSGSLKAN